MPAVQVQNKHYIPALNAFAALVAWLKPGRFAFRIGQLKAAVEPTAVFLSKEHERLIDAHVLFDVEPPKDDNDTRSGDDRPKTRRMRTSPSGVSEYDFGTKRDEFQKKFRDLMDDKTEIVVTRLLTDADIDAIEKNRIERLPRDGSGNAIQLPPVDFAALLPFMEPGKPALAVVADGQDDDDEHNTDR